MPLTRHHSLLKALARPPFCQFAPGHTLSTNSSLLFSPNVAFPGAETCKTAPRGRLKAPSRCGNRQFRTSLRGGLSFLSFRPEPPSLSFRPEPVHCHFDRSPFIVISTGARFLSFRPERVFCHFDRSHLHCHFDRSPKGGVEKSLKCRNRQNRTSLYGG